MSIEQALDERIRFLRTRKWVNHSPTNMNESCAVYDWEVARASLKIEARDFLENKLLSGLSLTGFNDAQASVEPVLAILEKGRALAGELGL
jgi:hypothetical protein